MELIAVTAPGLEVLVGAELAALGIESRVGKAGAEWSGGMDDVYRSNLHLRTASRVLVRIARFRARSFIELERHARRIDWSPYVSAGTPVHLRVTSRKSRLYHERGIGERFARWIGEAGGGGDPGAPPATVVVRAPEDDEESPPEGPGQIVVVRMLRDECLVSVDSSGALLHRRGYRQALGRAPLRETLGAATILAAGWGGQVPLLDPLCGAGTIPIEAALIARRIPPGLAMADREPRRFAFQRWSLFDASRWSAVVASAREGIAPAAPVSIQGSDRDAGGVAAAIANAERAGVGSDVEFRVAAVSAIEPPPGGKGLVITNPPYGVRVGEADGLRDLYATLGTLLRTRLPGWGLAMLSADERLERQMGLALKELLRTNNGGIPVRIVASTPDGG